MSSTVSVNNNNNNNNNNNLNIPCFFLRLSIPYSKACYTQCRRNRAVSAILDQPWFQKRVTNMRFPTMRHFTMCRLGQASAASF